MDEEKYRAEMAKQARIANLIALRALCVKSATVAGTIPVAHVTAELKREMGWA